MNSNHRTYYVCYQPDINSLTNLCRSIGEEKNLVFFKEDADIKYICKYIPVELRKIVFEQKYPDYKLISEIKK